MRRIMEKIKGRKAITLIALVVTIVVILILAGITVGMVTSDNGILKETKNAKEQAEIDNEKSIVETLSLSYLWKYLISYSSVFIIFSISGSSNLRAISTWTSSLLFNTAILLEIITPKYAIAK